MPDWLVTTTTGMPQALARAMMSAMPSVSRTVLDLVEIARFLDDDAVTIEEETGPCVSATTGREFAPGSVFVKRPVAHGVLQKAQVITGDYEAGEHAGRKGTGIDADPVVSYLRAVPADGVAVDHDMAEIGIRMEEFFADPHEVLRVLLVEGNPGPDAGMHEQEAVLEMNGLERVEEHAVAFGQVAPQQVARILAGRHTVGAQGLTSAQHGDPPRAVVIAVEEPDHGVVVVALEEDPFETVVRPRRIDQAVDHLARVGAPVNIVAEEDDQSAILRSGCGIVEDAAVEGRQEVRPSP